MTGEGPITIEVTTDMIKAALKCLHESGIVEFETISNRVAVSEMFQKAFEASGFSAEIGEGFSLILRKK